MVRRSDSPTLESSSPSGTEKPKVIYVMGQGRSGSTILGVTLGNCTEVFFAGELCTWLITSGKSSFKGPPERIEFWHDVGEHVNDGAELFGTEAFECLERSLSAFRFTKWPARRRLRERYQLVTEQLYRSIANRAGVTHVVDSSHLPLRARELQRMSGIDLYLIFLVRDLEGVVSSYMRHMNPNRVPRSTKRVSRINGYLWITYLLSIIVFLRQAHDRRLLVRHEDFLANPEGVLREILDFADSSAAIPDLTSLSTGMPLRGNPLATSKVIELRPQPDRPHRPSWLMRVVQRPWTLILTRLQPTATGASAHERVPPRD